MFDRSLSTRSDEERSVFVDTIRAVLAEHPVSLCVLFGSQATGQADAQSDVDVLVELTESASEDPGEAILSLSTDLSVALEQEAIDVALVDDVAPRVGLAALSEGELVLGSPERARELRDRFARQVEDRSTDSLRDRFDAALGGIRAAVPESGSGGTDQS